MTQQESIPAEPKPAIPVDLSRCILWGDKLRVLLNSYYISYGEINSLLREKGIFFHSSDKSKIVPLLSSCILTPGEFSRLTSHFVSRESAEKYNSEPLVLRTKDADWHGAILENFDNLVDPLTHSSEYEFCQQPTITSNSENELEIAYVLKKRDYSQDWIDQERNFPGKIIISRKDGELVLRVQKTHTSKETDLINSVIIRSVKSHCLTSNITVPDKEIKTKFDHFNNSERISFLLGFTGIAETTLSFDEVTDIEIVRDISAGKLPKDPAINWMEGKVRRMRVDGSGLDKVLFLKERTYHQYYFLMRMTATFKFHVGIIDGDCTITFAFSGKSTHDDDFSNSELVITIDRISTRKGKDIEKDIRRKIFSKISDKQEALLKVIEAKRTSSSATNVANQRTGNGYPSTLA